MRTPREAIAEILGRIEALGEEETTPLATAQGRVLARAVASDVDLPPFEKSMMDGYAVRARELSGEGGGTLRCVGESRAGASYEGSVPAGACVAIYTGAQLPADCDSVVMIEETEREGEQVRFSRSVREAQNVSPRAEILATGHPVYAPGRRLSAADLSVLAAVGCEPVPVRRRPRVTIFTTGDELVAPDRTPGPDQIREGNTLFLRASCERAGAVVVESGLLADDPSALELAFVRALEESDALITTGGVSMGKYDLVGEALEACGVEPVLHKVAIKPGKPIWFGLRGTQPVFGLPGNPVSSLLGFHVFVRPSLAKMEGAEASECVEDLRRARWTGGPTKPHWRQQNLPCELRFGEDGVPELAPLPWRGSADIVGVSRADAFAVVEAEAVAQPGELLDYRPLR